MPHLAPFSWALAPIIFWSLLLILSATLWWTSPPSFTTLYDKEMKPFPLWKWN